MFFKSMNDSEMSQSLVTDQSMALSERDIIVETNKDTHIKKR